MPGILAARALRSALTIVLLAAACGRPVIPGTLGVDPTLRLEPARGPALPPIPPAQGPLVVRVVYPMAGALIAARDSNFILGSVGHGGASLTINGHAVPVHPNGAFIAFLPLPSPEQPQYELIASLGHESAQAVHPVRLLAPRPLLADSGRLIVDEESITPRGALALRGDELVRVSIRAPGNAEVWVQAADGRRRALRRGDEPPALIVDARPPRDREGAALLRTANGITPQPPGRYLRDSLSWAADVPARWLADSLTLVAARGADTLVFALERADTVAAAGLGWAMLGPDSVAVSDTDRVVMGRPEPAGTYKWFFLPGTVMQATGVMRGFVRVRLDEQLEAWVAREDVRLFGGDRAAPRRVVPSVRVRPDSHWVDVIFPTGERPPYQVQVEGNTLVLTLYGTRANFDMIHWVAGDSLIRMITWEQVTSDRARFVLHLDQPPYGWLAMQDRGAFVLRVRRPPVVDPERPLLGITVAVDAGHPPAGATGPTGLYEAVPVLAIATRLERLLQARGATVVMTRATHDTLALVERPIMARRAGAHALVSIHLNALPDGVNPFPAHGTGSYFFHPQAEPLAREIQRGMVHWMGLRDLGIYYSNLALARPTWMPSVLCEGAFIMIPEQEYAVRTAEFQERYALGVADGLERYFRRLGAGNGR
ncbi:MAG TPA: N-acetylmuramoyl-L-alanine amidase [Gemmatimonadaceae bacterium]|nr:N-acetylmuramoyl-L-alanine amidase [Gemmatimonadaceae bacterium]